MKGIKKKLSVNLTRCILEITPVFLLPALRSYLKASARSPIWQGATDV